ncbi:histidine kinase [Streptomyces sp. NPDC051018]|uniref:sensor histidine kinase n=1 Tax=Streptomyces sp. NPDC051018 TaxID=3365639 RepID=UPI0037A55D06
MRVKGWSGRSGLAKVDLYTRGTVYLIVWIAALGLTAMTLSSPVRERAPLPLAVLGPVLGIAIGLVCGRLARRAMDSYLGQGRVSSRLIGWAVAMTAAESGVILALTFTVPGDDLLGLFPSLMAWTLMPLLTVHCLLVRKWTTVLVQVAVLTVVCGLVALFVGRPGAVLVTFVVIGFVNGWMAFTSRASMWVLGVMWQLRHARDVEARLAVAEERLRFGRDLHDVLGRNLAVVALKSELAVQLARRGRPEAVDQMSEVQRIAQDSQREVRDVVRGYREADLRVELEGARAVLDAAGITCTVVQDEVELPGEVRSALGWVVREATTNVLRHGDARRCTISLGTVDDSVVLVVENDRAGEVSFLSVGGGSGLAGLRERLSAVDGTLNSGPVRGGRYRVTARVPLRAGTPAGAGAETAVGAGTMAGAGAETGRAAGSGREQGPESGRGAGTGPEAGGRAGTGREPAVGVPLETPPAAGAAAETAREPSVPGRTGHQRPERSEWRDPRPAPRRIGPDSAPEQGMEGAA